MTHVWTVKVIDWSARRCVAQEIAQQGDKRTTIGSRVCLDTHDEALEWLRWIEDESIEKGFEYRCRYGQFVNSKPVEEKTFMVPYDHLTAIYHGWGEA